MLIGLLYATASFAIFGISTPLILYRARHRDCFVLRFFFQFLVEPAGNIITEFVPMRYILSLVLTSLPLLLMSATRAELPSVGPCHQAEITLRSDDLDGLYDGVSQGGTTLVLHNTGSRACMLPTRAVLTFSDAAHHPMVVERRPAQGRPAITRSH